jgi:DNA-binding NtrC family response regulator
MTKAVELLIVSGRLETKRALLRILDGLPLNVYAVANVEQAEDALKQYGIEVVLCDEHFSDGTYHDVLALIVDRRPKVQFIVMLCAGGREAHREAIQLGATEVIRFPLQSTDIELALIHAMRNQTATAHLVA